MNGWTSFETSPTDDAQSFGKKALQEYRKGIFEEWLKLKDGVLYSTHMNESAPHAYSLNRSAFWRTACAIWAGLSRRTPEGRWQDNIAWSNLYKISPKVSGNPPASVCKAQGVCCQNLLSAEIEEFAPTHILLVTGWDGWFYHTAYEYNFSRIFAEFQKSTDQKKMVEGTAFFQLPNGRKIPAVITCRPDNTRKVKSETLFTQNVLRAFKELDVTP